MLQSSGLIKLSEIRTEIGIEAGSSFLLNVAEENGYVYLNDCSESKPDKTQVSRMGEWYSYNHSASCCSYTLSGTYAGNDYNLSNYYLYFKNKTTGDQINFLCYSLDRPNRFNIYDYSNNLLETSGWKGTASYAGPWGATLNDPTTGILNLTYDSTKDYVLKIESGPADPVSPVSDSWEVTITCSSPPTPTPTPTPTPPPPSNDWECILGTCTNVGSGAGSYPDYDSCIASGCESPP